MTVWICTDMEGLAGISHWDQCYDPDDASPLYLYGRAQLTADANAAIAGCFDAGAREVRLCDGHGRNSNMGFLTDELDPRAERVWIASRAPLRWEGLDASVDAVLMIGQHAMAGTIGAFLDHTQVPRTLCGYWIDGCRHGEIGQMALYAGANGTPLAYVSGDEAACAEATRLFPHVGTTATKRGLTWGTCELYDCAKVRAAMRRDVAGALRNLASAKPWRPKPPLEIAVEWACTEHADAYEGAPGVTRLDAHTIAWRMTDPMDVFCWPSRQ